MYKVIHFITHVLCKNALIMHGTITWAADTLPGLFGSSRTVWQWRSCQELASFKISNEHASCVRAC